MGYDNKVEREAVNTLLMLGFTLKADDTWEPTDFCRQLRNTRAWADPLAPPPPGFTSPMVELGITVLAQDEIKRLARIIQSDRVRIERLRTALTKIADDCGDIHDMSELAEIALINDATLSREQR